MRKTTPRSPLRLAVAALALFALAAVPGCKDKDPETPTGTKQTGAKGQKPSTAPPKVAKLEAPADVLVYGGSAPLDKALGAVHGVAKQVMPVPDLTQMVGPAMQGEFRLSDATVIDLKKPIYFAVLNPKVYKPAPAVVVAPITNKDAVMKALPKTGQKADDAGNTVSYLKFEGAKSPVYVNFIDGYAVFSRAPDAFPKNKAFLQALTGLKVSGQGTAFAEVDHAIAAFGPEFDAGLKEAAKTMEMAAKSTPGGGAQADSLKKMVDFAGASAREIDQLRVSLVTADDGLALDFWIDPKKGSKLAGYASALEGTGGDSLIAKLPANSPFLVHFTADWKKFLPMAKALTESFVTEPVFGADKAKGDAYMASMERYMNGLGDEMAMAGLVGQNGMDLGVLFQVKDAKALRDGQSEMAAIYQNPDAAAYYEKMGVKVEYNAEVYKVGDVPVSQIKTDLTNMPPEAAQMAGMFSELMNQYIAVGETLGVMGYGASAKGTIEGFFNGTIKGGLDQSKGVKRAIANAAANRTILVYVNLIELVKSVKLGGMNPLAPVLKDVTAETGVAISAGATGGNLQLKIDVPVETVKQGMAAFEKGKSAF